jgi:hypothetical protein
MDEKKNGLNDGNGYGDSRVQARTPCRLTGCRRMIIGCVASRIRYLGGPATSDQWKRGSSA